MPYRNIVAYILSFIIIISFAYFYLQRKNQDNDAPIKNTALQPSPLVNQSTANTLSKIDVESIVEEFINKNPKIIIDSVGRYYVAQRKEVEQGIDIADKVSLLRESLFDERTPQIGNKNALIKIVEFFDYDCTFCKAMLDIKIQLLQNNQDVAIFLKEIPVVNTNSSFANKAAVAVYMIDSSKYFFFHQALLNNKSSLTPDAVFSIAKKLGIDINKLKSFIEDSALENIMNNNTKLAQDLQIEGAPTYIINNRIYFGTLSYELMQELIDKARSNITHDNNANASTSSNQDPQNNNLQQLNDSQNLSQEQINTDHTNVPQVKKPAQEDVISENKALKESIGNTTKEIKNSMEVKNGSSE